MAILKNLSLLPAKFHICDKFWQNCVELKSAGDLRDVFGLLRRHENEAILIKGWAATRNYPPGIVRNYVDFDICVNPKQLRQVEKLLQKFPAQNYQIDLHCGLRHLDTVSWENLFANSILIGEGNDQIRVLRPEDHLRVICVHWLTDGGAYRERLFDVYYAVANRPPDFDWERFLDVVAPLRRRWLIAVLLLTERYLGLDLTDTPLEFEERELPAWLIKTIEREWSKESRLQPLAAMRRRPREFLRQIGKRLPPNAVHATVSCEGEFDETTRLKYQIRNIFQRI